MAQLSKALEAERRRLLQDFPDIEYADGSLKTLPRAVQARNDEEAVTPEMFEQKAAYMRLAGMFAHSHRFTNKRDKEIWHLYAEGLTYREIAKQTGTYVRLVNDTVNRLRAVMAGDQGDRGDRYQRRESFVGRLCRMDARTLLQLAPLFLAVGR